MTIKFGTDGWRAVISETFTFGNLRLVSQAIADYIREENSDNPSVIIGFDTRFLSDRYAAEGIRMNNILPGYVDNYPESQETLDQIPMGRYARSAEIGKTALFLISEGGGYITGQNIRVDGGLTRSV